MAVLQFTAMVSLAAAALFAYFSFLFLYPASGDPSEPEITYLCVYHSVSQHYVANLI